MIILLNRYYLLICSFLIIVGFSSKAQSKKDKTSNDKDFIQIFDGKTFGLWKGDSTYWSIKDNCLVGEVTPETLLKRNSFIIWHGQMPDNFEMKVEFKISENGNSGINYRSEMIDSLPYALRGYQADLDGQNNYTGSNYEERHRTTLASHGEKTILPELNDKNAALNDNIKDNHWLPKKLKEEDKTALTKANVKPNEWNEYHIIANKNVLQHYVNGVLLSEVTDNDSANRKFNGLLGVQVHVGPPMKVSYRNIRLKKLDK